MSAHMLVGISHWGPGCHFAYKQLQQLERTAGMDPAPQWVRWGE